ncbi:MAG: hypothetical protein ACI8SA_001538 [Dokdonia sp.]
MDKSPKGLIVLGYINAFIGGLFGLFIGKHLNYSKKILPNGHKVLNFSSHHRKHGFNTYWIGIVSLIDVKIKSHLH